MTCDCMTEADPLGGPDRVLTHSLNCPEHPDHADEPMTTTHFLNSVAGSLGFEVEHD